MAQQQPTGRLTLQAFLANPPGLLDEVRRVFDTDQEASQLLETIGFPAEHRPNFNSPGMTVNNYWRAVAREIDRGVSQGGFEALLAAAAHRYPHNPIFGRYASWQAPPPTRDEQATRGASLFIITGGSTDELTRLVRALARGLQIPGAVELAVTTQTGLTVFDLPDADGDQAHRLAGAVRDALPQPSPARVNTALNGHRATLLRQLFVEGPDQARFELENVEATTAPREVARAVMDQYADEKFWPRDPRTGLPRPAVVDTDKPTGETVRLDPDRPLVHQGVRDGQTLRVSPESRAGSVDPVLHSEAIARVLAQVTQYAESHPDFLVEATDPIAPTEYVFTFTAPSFGPPPAPGAAPVPIDEHQVFLFLPPGFPIQAPQVAWMTPIFHPNIHPKEGAVCLGALADRYQPGLDFGRLCQMLVDIAAFRNYETSEGYNLEAQHWAVSPEGQAAIESRGGVSVDRSLRRAVSDVVTRPTPLTIRRLTP